MTVKVVTDSASDITREDAEKFGIEIVPVYLRFGEQVYRDNIDITGDEFYTRLTSDPVHPSTASPSPGDFSTIYEKLSAETDEIVSIHVTSKHSSVYSSALAGMKSIKKKNCRIEVIDSKGVSMWQGLIAIAAAKAAAAGGNLNNVMNKVNETISQLRAVALLDTIKYIVKGGRLGMAAPAISKIESILHVKLMLALHDGELRPSGMVRSQKKGIDKIRDMIKSASHLEELAIGYTTTIEEARALSEYATSLLPNLVPHIYRLGPVLGVHAGPGALVTVFK
jgi:DegV family protein with EDD domain